MEVLTSRQESRIGAIEDHSPVFLSRSPRGPGANSSREGKLIKRTRIIPAADAPVGITERFWHGIRKGYPWRYVTPVQITRTHPRRFAHLAPRYTRLTPVTALAWGSVQTRRAVNFNDASRQLRERVFTRR